MNFLLSVLLLIPFVVRSQVDSVTVEKVSIINAKHKVNGIYRTFDEFRRNEPFYTDSFKVLIADHSDRIMINRFVDELVFRDENDKLKQQGAKRFFGFCRNDTVYLTLQVFHLTYASAGFYPIVQMGHLSVIQLKKHIGTPMGDGTTVIGGGLVGFSPIPFPFIFPIIVKDVPVEKLFVLDYMSGSVFQLSTILLLNKFEKWDRQLYKEFRKSKTKRETETQIEFLRKFNQRHPIEF